MRAARAQHGFVTQGVTSDTWGDSVNGLPQGETWGGQGLEGCVGSAPEERLHRAGAGEEFQLHSLCLDSPSFL